MTRPIFFNKCGHYKYEQCVCPVCFPVTNFIETMMEAAARRQVAPATLKDTPAP